jgi:hypothetical protein
LRQESVTAMDGVQYFGVLRLDQHQASNAVEETASVRQFLYEPWLQPA